MSSSLRENHCLRCRTVALNELEGGTGIRFFECSACGRQYAQKAGKGMTFRWRHPITLALYSVQFDESPGPRAAEIAAALIRGRSAQQLDVFTREFRLELSKPTQQIRDTLDCRAPEEELRCFLQAVTERIEDHLER